MRIDLPCRRFTGAIPLIVWSLAVFAGMVGMVRYQSRASVNAIGDEHRAPAQWPASVHIARDPQRATLIMSLHPHCPCSRASLRELAILLSRAGDRATAVVLFVRPDGAPADWLNSDLWRDASAMPGVRVRVDANGADSRALGASTSGEVVVYDAAGSLRFTGGITDGRGHEGENAGLEAALSILSDSKPPGMTTMTTSISSAPVYGCPLLGCGQNATINTSGSRRND